MTYKEFKRQIEELGYKLSGTDADITVIVDGFQTVLVSKHNHSALQTTSGIFNIHGKDRSHLLMMAAELAITPINER